MRGGAWDFARSGMLCQAAFLLERWLWSGSWFRCRFACPNQHLTVLIDSKPLDLDDLHFEVFQIRVIEGKLALQGAVRRPSSLLEEGNHLVEYVVEIHYRPSSSSCNNALASLRSAVSNPSVNQW